MIGSQMFDEVGRRWAHGNVDHGTLTLTPIMMPMRGPIEKGSRKLINAVMLAPA